jgi:hypothetical protein
MNSKLTIGSIVFGAAGVGCRVLSIEGDTLTVKTGNGIRKIPSSKVQRVIPPGNRFEIGDRVQYIGSDFNLKTQYVGVLEVWEISKKDIGSYACLKPNGRVTSWIEFADLQLVEVV